MLFPIRLLKALRPVANLSRRFVFAALLLCLAAAPLLTSCASARRPAWPPPPGEPATFVTVYGERFHSLLALPRQPRGAEEWAFGERVWFYEEKDADNQKRREYAAFFTDAMRALFWPNSGVIEVSKADKPFDARNPEVHADVWRIPVSQEGLRRMRAYLDRSIGQPKALYDDGWQVYYIASSRYHVLHTCHHYVALALREAGVPVHPGWCFFPGGLWLQLDRLAKKSARAY